MKTISQEAGRTDSIKKIAQTLNCGDPLKNAFDYAYKNIVYYPDPMNEQNIKTPARSLKDKRGNCVDYAVLLGSILFALGIPYYFRVAGYNEPRNFEHVYVVTKSGVVLDPVLGQPQDGTASFENRPAQGRFNEQKPYTTKKDF